jgi:hypothetical protein
VRSACLLVVACRWPIRLSVARWTPKPASTPDWVPNRPLHCPLDTQTHDPPRLGAQSTTPLPAGHPNPRPPATGCPIDHSIARWTPKPTTSRDWVPNRPLHCPLDTQTHGPPRLGAQPTTRGPRDRRTHDPVQAHSAPRDQVPLQTRQRKTPTAVAPARCPCSPMSRQVHELQALPHCGADPPDNDVDGPRLRQASECADHSDQRHLTRRIRRSALACASDHNDKEYR